MKYNFIDYLDGKLNEDNEDKDSRLNNKGESVYQTKRLDLANIDDLVFCDDTQVVIDGVKYIKGVYKDDLPCVFTKKGQLKMSIDLYDIENHKSKTLVYDLKTKKFTVENKF